MVVDQKYGSHLWVTGANAEEGRWEDGRSGKFEKSRKKIESLQR